MGSEIKNLMDEIDGLVAKVLTSLAENKPVIIHNRTSSMGFDVTTNLSIKLGILESLSAQGEDLQRTEPLVDVIETNSNVKIIAMLPGIKQEDIETSIEKGFITIRIRKGKDQFYKSIQCDVSPDQLVTKSLRYNNSVLEIVFSKGGK